MVSLFYQHSDKGINCALVQIHISTNLASLANGKKCADIKLLSEEDKETHYFQINKCKLQM